MQMSKFDAIRADIADIQKKHRARPEMMHGVKLPYYRRGEMAIPAFRMKAGGDVETDGRAQSLKVMNKAAQMPIDFFFYDLEDAAPDNPEYKQFARKFIVEALNTNDYGKRIVAFRPNNIRTPYFEDDIVEVGHDGDVGRRLEREAPALDLLVLGRLLRRGLRGGRQASELRLLRDDQIPGVGLVEEVLGETRRLARELHVQGVKRLLLLVRLGE